MINFHHLLWIATICLLLLLPYYHQVKSQRSSVRSVDDSSWRQRRRLHSRNAINFCSAAAELCQLTPATVDEKAAPSTTKKLFEAAAEAQEDIVHITFEESPPIKVLRPIRDVFFKRPLPTTKRVVSKKPPKSRIMGKPPAKEISSSSRGTRTKFGIPFVEELPLHKLLRGEGEIRTGGSVHFKSSTPNNGKSKNSDEGNYTGPGGDNNILEHPAPSSDPILLNNLDQFKPPERIIKQSYRFLPRRVGAGGIDENLAESSSTTKGGHLKSDPLRVPRRKQTIPDANKTNIDTPNHLQSDQKWPTVDRFTKSVGKGGHKSVGIYPHLSTTTTKRPIFQPPAHLVVVTPTTAFRKPQPPPAAVNEINRQNSNQYWRNMKEAQRMNATHENFVTPNPIKKTLEKQPAAGGCWKQTNIREGVLAARLTPLDFRRNIQREQAKTECRRIPKCNGFRYQSRGHFASFIFIETQPPPLHKLRMTHPRQEGWVYIC